MSDKIDVLGIGNALMDVLIKADGELIISLGLQKGMFNLVDEARYKEIFNQIKSRDPQYVPGGCVSNTIGALATLGSSAMFYGHVAQDEVGERYTKSLEAEGVIPRLSTGSGATGCAITLVTPDAERTFAVHLGAAPNLEFVNIDDIKNAKVLYISGYGLEAPGISKAILDIVQVAKEHGVQIAFDAADPNLVARNHRFILEFVSNHVDICFMNEKEAEAMFHQSPVHALNSLSKCVEIAIVKNGEELYHADIQKVEAIDTTGAGDAYAAGFLHAYCRGRNLTACARTGSRIAAQVVAKMGARLEKPVIEVLQ